MAVCSVHAAESACSTQVSRGQLKGSLAGLWCACGLQVCLQVMYAAGRLHCSCMRSQRLAAQVACTTLAVDIATQSTWAPFRCQAAAAGHLHASADADMAQSHDVVCMCACVGAVPCCRCRMCHTVRPRGPPLHRGTSPASTPTPAGGAAMLGLESVSGGAAAAAGVHRCEAHDGNASPLVTEQQQHAHTDATFAAAGPGRPDSKALAQQRAAYAQAQARSLSALKRAQAQARAEQAVARRSCPPPEIGEDRGHHQKGPVSASSARLTTQAAPRNSSASRLGLTRGSQPGRGSQGRGAGEGTRRRGAAAAAATGVSGSCLLVAGPDVCCALCGLHAPSDGECCA